MEVFENERKIKERKLEYLNSVKKDLKKNFIRFVISVLFILLIYFSVNVLDRTNLDVKSRMGNTIVTVLAVSMLIAMVLFLFTLLYVLFFSVQMIYYKKMYEKNLLKRIDRYKRKSPISFKKVLSKTRPANVMDIYKLIEEKMNEDPINSKYLDNYFFKYKKYDYNRMKLISYLVSEKLEKSDLIFMVNQLEVQSFFEKMYVQIFSLIAAAYTLATSFQEISKSISENDVGIDIFGIIFDLFKNVFSSKNSTGNILVFFLLIVFEIIILLAYQGYREVKIRNKLKIICSSALQIKDV